MKNSYKESPTSERIFDKAEYATYHQPLEGGVDYALNIDAEPLGHDERYGCDISAIITTSREENASQDDRLDSFALIDLRSSPLMRDSRGVLYKNFGGMSFKTQIEFLLVEKQFRADNQVSWGYKGIRRGESVTVGQSDPVTSERFRLRRTTSQSHFSIRYADDGTQLFIRDNGSTNGTSVDSGTQLRNTAYQNYGANEQQQYHRNHQQGHRQQHDHQERQEDKKQEQMDPQLRRELDRLRSYIATGGDAEGVEIDDNMLIGLVNNIKTLHTQGLDSRKVRARILRDLHPDRFQNSPNELARNAVLFKAADFLLRNGR